MPSRSRTPVSSLVLTSVSPNEQHYVEVVTPVAANATEPVVVDVNGYQCYSDDYESVESSSGLRMYAWSHELRSQNRFAAPYFWFACLCPCIAVPQLEVRMGLTSSFKCAVLSCFVSQLTLVGLWLLLAAALWSYTRGKGDSVHWTLMLATFCVTQTIVIASRVASLRGKVRARFAIPGSGKHDLQLAVFHPTHAVHQIAQHLACDRVRPCAAPTTLPAYEV